MDPRPTGRSVQRLSDEAFHVDYHDADHVYLVTVRQVPRVRLPLERPVRVGDSDGVGVELAEVTVANHVEIVLDGEQGPARDAAFEAFTARYKHWEAGAARGSPPPPWPEEQLTRIAIEVSDDIGTAYRKDCGQSGGMGTEWECRLAFLPTPPPTAHSLTVVATPPGGPRVTVQIPLPST